MKRAPLVVIGVSVAFLIACCSVQAQVSFFQPPTFSENGAFFVADFNGDGKPDILSGDGTMNLGNGDGTFTPGTTVSGGVLAVADFNGDGKPDVLQQGTGTLLVLLGKGDGTFQAPISSSSGVPSLQSVAAADLNADGNADVVGLFGTSVLVFLSKGDGSFDAGVPYSLGPSSVGFTLLLLADFNGDGKNDIGVSLPGINVAGDELVLLGNGDGTFQAPKSSTTVYSAGPSNVAAGDFNGDGKLDLAMSGYNAGYSQASLYILAGNGDGTFQAPVAAFAGYGPIAVADLNGDGKLDIAFTGNDPTVAQVYLGNGDGTFSNQSNYVIDFPAGGPFIPSVAPVAIADFNRDGKLDIAALTSVLLGNGDGSFNGVPLGLVPDYLMNISAAVAISDFENNGKLDVAVVPYPNPDGPDPSSLYILRNNGSGVLTLIHTYALFQPGYRVFAADLNGDAKPDLVVSGKDPSTNNWSYTILLGNGDGSFQPPILYQQSFIGSFAAIGDFNNDHKPDLVALAGDSAAIFLGNGDGTFFAPIYTLDGGAYSLLAADFNGDGKLDLAAPFLMGTTYGTGILYGNGDGTFQPEAFPTSLNSFGASDVADFNNDGRPDLGFGVELNNGDGTFTAANPLQGPPGITNGFADLNGDGVLDVSVIDDVSSQVQYSGVGLGKGDGTFGSFQNTLNDGLITVVFLADMNSDGLPDIVFPRGMGVGVLLNTTHSRVNPDFQLVVSGPSSQTISGGQTADFTLSFSSVGSFTGTVSLSCAITPVVSPAATCGLSSSTVNLTGSGSQTVTVSVKTTGSSSATLLLPDFRLPWTMTPWILSIGMGGMMMLNRRRRTFAVRACAAPILILALGALMSCGGNSTSTTTTHGTPPGTYTATVTATSGSLNHNTALQVIVQ